jgi:hypothetical protein
MNWRAAEQIIGDLEEGEPTKPSKPGYVGSVGSPQEESFDIEVKSRSVEEAVREAEQGIPWADWKAAALNQLFKEYGVTAQPGRITAATFRQCETGRERVDSAETNEQSMSRVEATE